MAPRPIIVFDVTESLLEAYPLGRGGTRRRPGPDHIGDDADAIADQLIARYRAEETVTSRTG